MNNKKYFKNCILISTAVASLVGVAVINVIYFNSGLFSKGMQPDFGASIFTLSVLIFASTAAALTFLPLFLFFQSYSKRVNKSVAVIIHPQRDAVISMLVSFPIIIVTLLLLLILENRLIEYFL